MKDADKQTLELWRTIRKNWRLFAKGKRQFTDKEIAQIKAMYEALREHFGKQLRTKKR